MNRRHRDLAPVTPAAWAAIDEEARRSLSSLLAARHLVAFTGPLGWEATGVRTGHSTAVKSPAAGVSANARSIRPLVELRTEFVLARSELDLVDRGGVDPDLSPLQAAAKAIAHAEDALVFDGHADIGIEGITAASPHQPVTMGEDFSAFPRWVSSAVSILRGAGVDGPYCVALGEQCYASVMQATEQGGYPVIEHLRLLAKGPVVWAPAVDGAVVLSMRGADFEMHVGEDLGIGYVRHDDTTVTFSIDESVTFTNHSPEAAVSLHHR